MRAMNEELCRGLAPKAFGVGRSEGGRHGHEVALRSGHRDGHGGLDSIYMLNEK